MKLYYRDLVEQVGCGGRVWGGCGEGRSMRRMKLYYCDLVVQMGGVGRVWHALQGKILRFGLKATDFQTLTLCWIRLWVTSRGGMGSN